MKGALPTTIFMGVIAAIAAAGAAYWYPKTSEVLVDAKVNQNLFEAYETGDVRSISITQFNGDSNRMERFGLRRKGERWVIPSAGDFPATQISRIGEVAKSLLDRKVLALATEDEQGHIEFGVVDPTESADTPNRSSLGMRVDLVDRNRSELASLIIGKEVEDRGSDSVRRYYVRIPGQPAVYELEIPKTLFRTRLEDWIDPNLMELPPPGATEVTVAAVTVDQYRLDPEKLGSAERENVYRFDFEFEPEAQGVKKFQFESWKDGKFEELELSPEQKQQVSSTLRSVGNLRYIDVIAKPKEVATALRSAETKLTAAEIEPLQQFGFRVEDGQLESANGQVRVVTSDGVAVRLLIGSLAQRADTENLDLHFHGMLVAELSESMFESEEPKKPAGVAEDSAENKAYLRAKQELDRKRSSATLRIKELNRNWSKWIYVIPETTINAVRPDVTL